MASYAYQVFSGLTVGATYDLSYEITAETGAGAAFTDAYIDDGTTQSSPQTSVWSQIGHTVTTYSDTFVATQTSHRFFIEITIGPSTCDFDDVSITERVTPQELVARTLAATVQADVDTNVVGSDPTVAQGADLVTNGDFPTDITGWTGTGDSHSTAYGGGCLYVLQSGGL